MSSLIFRCNRQHLYILPKQLLLKVYNTHTSVSKATPSQRTRRLCLPAKLELSLEVHFLITLLLSYSLTANRIEMDYILNDFLLLIGGGHSHQEIKTLKRFQN